MTLKIRRQAFWWEFKINNKISTPNFFLVSFKLLKFFDHTHSVQKNFKRLPRYLFNRWHQTESFGRKIFLYDLDRSWSHGNSINFFQVFEDRATTASSNSPQRRWSTSAAITRYFDSDPFYPPADFLRAAVMMIIIIALDIAQECFFFVQTVEIIGGFSLHRKNCIIDYKQYLFLKDL